MIIRFFLSCLLLIVTLGAVAQTKSKPGQANSNSSKSKHVHQVVIQITSSDSLVWKALTNNIRHLKDAWGDSVHIEVVAHGPGIDFLLSLKTTQQKEITHFKNEGVVFAGCANTLKARNLTKEALVPEAMVVPSGVAEVIIKQEEGWSYLKAGF